MTTTTTTTTTTMATTTTNTATTTTTATATATTTTTTTMTSKAKIKAIASIPLPLPLPLRHHHQKRRRRRRRRRRLQTFVRSFLRRRRRRSFVVVVVGDNGRCHHVRVQRCTFLVHGTYIICTLRYYAFAHLQFVAYILCTDTVHFLYMLYLCTLSVVIMYGTSYMYIIPVNSVRLRKCTIDVHGMYMMCTFDVHILYAPKDVQCYSHCVHGHTSPWIIYNTALYIMCTVRPYIAAWRRLR